MFWKLATVAALIAAFALLAALDKDPKECGYIDGEHVCVDKWRDYNGY